MSEREKENKIQGQSIIQEEELDQVTGGEQEYYKVNGCPYGHTKLVITCYGFVALYPECVNGCIHYYKTNTYLFSGCKIGVQKLFEW